MLKNDVTLILFTGLFGLTVVVMTNARMGPLRLPHWCGWDGGPEDCDYSCLSYEYPAVEAIVDKDASTRVCFHSHDE